MGLSTSHDCWDGSYGGFGQWRNALAVAAGYQLVEVGTESGFTYVSADLPDHAGPLADRLEELLPALAGVGAPPPPGQTRVVPLGHTPVLPETVTRWVLATHRFIAGLREAARAGEPVEFH
ncbi:hypothetical protein [Nocardiopsis synnemataformans]|uniref:hypothetical protein n=1 Tax=Nocardiopsis synnemataformans TaxID=61305 RepID=UPI003EB80A31